MARKKKEARGSKIGDHMVGKMSKLREARIALGYSQEALAKKLKVQQSSLSYWERTLYPPRDPRVQARLLRILSLKTMPEYPLW